MKDMGHRRISGWQKPKTRRDTYLWWVKGLSPRYRYHDSGCSRHLQSSRLRNLRRRVWGVSMKLWRLRDNEVLHRRYCFLRVIRSSRYWYGDPETISFSGGENGYAWHSREKLKLGSTPSSSGLYGKRSRYLEVQMILHFGWSPKYAIYLSPSWIPLAVPWIGIW